MSARTVKIEHIATPGEIKKYSQPSFFLELREYVFYFLKVFLTIALLYIVVRFAIFDLIGVSGKSMFPNYNEVTTNDAIYIDQFTPLFSDYQRGDVIVIIAPEQCDRNRSLYIKRVIGLPGEQVALEGGDVYIINEQYPAPGIKIDESAYLQDTVKTFKKANQDDGLRHVEPVLGPDEYYFLGDNRPGSADSRVCGPITKNRILGREFFRLSPPDKQGWWEEPTYNISTQN
jgi:signal peptidase I